MLELSGELELVRQIGRGDAAAYRLLVERETRYLYGIAHGLAGNAADAEDLVQETFVGLLKGRFRGESSLRTWLVRILVRQAAMMRRTRHRRREGPSLDDAANRGLTVGSKGGSHDGSKGMAIDPHGPGGRMLRSAGAVADARMDLSLMLDSLSGDHREVVVLRELQGMTYDEIAATLGIPRGTVESRLHRAREQLRTRYKDYL